MTSSGRLRGVSIYDVRVGVSERLGVESGCFLGVESGDRVGADVESSARPLWFEVLVIHHVSLRQRNNVDMLK